MNITRVKVLAVFGTLLALSIMAGWWAAVIVFGFITVLGYFTTSKESNKEWEDQDTHPDTGENEHCYYGDKLNFSKETIINILSRRSPYFNSLNKLQQDKFTERLDAFMKTKTFKTHDTRGFREMPVLISAAAIQVSFGLEEYLLPQFEFIHIYPEEFINTDSSDHFLEGNVSGRSINISWKHFLEGFLYPDDGDNVGLHEMAHAYYYQNFISRENIDPDFVSRFPQYNNTANKVLALEKKPGNDLFADYGLRNFQEFWATSVELFFEKPADLNNTYPDLYEVLKRLLNQDPLNSYPLPGS
jgi:Mlc titration factor MtfA (ptsG expression regulator)